jgi:hypothetical protein
VPNIYRYFFDPRFSGSQFQDLDIEVYLIKIANYVPIGDWRNNEQQKTLMIEHLREDIIFMYKRIATRPPRLISEEGL